MKKPYVTMQVGDKEYKLKFSAAASVEAEKKLGKGLMASLQLSLIHILFGSSTQTLLAHRGSYKTTVLSLFLAIYPVVRPAENVLFFRKTDTDVTEVIGQAQKILESPVMRKIVRNLYGVDLQLEKATGSEIHTNLCTSAKGISQVLGLGIGTSITGKHADVVVTDDIVNIKDRISRAERERTKMQYMELQNIVNRTGRIINTGTPWHKEDAVSMMRNVSRYDLSLIHI